MPTPQRKKKITPAVEVNFWVSLRFVVSALHRLSPHNEGSQKCEKRKKGKFYPKDKKM